MRTLRAAMVTLAAAVLATGCSAASSGPAPSAVTAHTPAPVTTAPVTTPATPPPVTPAPGGTGPPSHVVVVVLENKAQDQVIGNPDAPFLNQLARTGANYTDSFAITHPSQPNYVALFAGSTLGVTGDSCPQQLTGSNLAAQLRGAGLSFAGYSEGLPQAGYTGCSSGAYARKHAPWVNFADLPASVNLPFSAFPTQLSALPRLSFVIPDLEHDMHDGSIAMADTWLRTNLGRYAQWARQNDSLLVVTFDEDDFTTRNQITTIAYGARVVTGTDPTRIDHCRVLGTFEAWYALPRLGCAQGTAPIRSMWR